MLPVTNENHDNTPLLATIGRGYRSLLTRYTDVPSNMANTITSPVSTNNSFLISNRQNMFVLLWRAEHWGTS